MVKFGLSVINCSCFNQVFEKTFFLVETWILIGMGASYNYVSWKRIFSTCRVETKQSILKIFIFQVTASWKSSLPELYTRSPTFCLSTCLSRCKYLKKSKICSKESFFHAKTLLESWWPPNRVDLLILLILSMRWREEFLKSNCL